MRVKDGKPVHDGKCPECGRWMELKEGVLPYHDQFPPLKMVCPGSKLKPREVRC